MQAKVFNLEGQEVGKVSLDDKVFGAEYNEDLIHQAVVTYLANQRQGTKSTLTRSEVAGGGRKPWRQKGTGRARQGSIRAPQWVHGGVVFAPKPRDFEKKMNAQMRRGAFISALSAMMKEKAIVVVDNMNIDAKTKAAVKVLDALKTNRRVTVVTESVNDNAIRAFANLADASVTTADILNTYDLVVSDYVVMTKDAIKKIEEGNK
ncbi:MAG: 50S ribosomal protein L4 [Clostridiales bacterium]|nr:50S ribosomal protein L4 [Clostridiales bacterium]